MSSDTAQSFRRMIRAGGLALIAAAVIQAAATIFDADLTADVDAIAARAWIPSHLAFCVAYTLVLPGLVALYLRQADGASWIADAGLVLALFGSALTVAVSMLVGAALPVMSRHAPDLTRSLAFFEPDRPLHFMRPAVALTALTYFPGFVLTGAATIRAAVLPRPAAVCLIVGALGTLGALGGPGSLARFITIGGSLLLGIAFGWFGYRLARG